LKKSAAGKVGLTLPKSYTDDEPGAARRNPSFVLLHWAFLAHARLAQQLPNANKGLGLTTELLANGVTGQIWPAGHYLPTPDLNCNP